MTAKFVNKEQLIESVINCLAFMTLVGKAENEMLPFLTTNDLTKLTNSSNVEGSIRR